MKQLFVLTLILFVASSCTENIVESINLNQQLETEINRIDFYLDSLGYVQGEIDTTQSRVRYVILDSGNADSIEETDIVYFNYIGKLLNDTIFDTSIDSIAIAAGLKDTTSTISSEPLIITYSESGWSFQYTASGSSKFVQGFADGIGASFKHLKVGGSVLILMPSQLGYGANFQSRIPAYSVLAFELFPTKVIKQD